MRDAIIFDADGTLCNVLDIRHHLLDKSIFDYHRYHMESINCPAVSRVVRAAIEAHEAGTAVLIVTARVEKYRPETEFWLDKNLPIPYDEMYMRADGDRRDDAVIKRELLARIKGDGYNIIHAWEDKQSVAELWESEGIPVTVVEGFGFE